MRILLTILSSLLLCGNALAADLSPFVVVDHVIMENRPKDVYNRRYSASVAFLPIFKNVGPKTITGIKYDIAFKDTFGDIVYKTDDKKLAERIKPNKKNSDDILWVAKNNPYMQGEIYDKLFPLFKNNTGTPVVTVKHIVFEDGSHLQWGEE